MVFKTCTYCGLFEMDENTLFSKLNKKGILSIHSIHIKCKEEKEAKNKEKHKYVKKIKEQKTIIDKINNTPERKICSKCDENKHISEFYIKRDFTFNSWCKECVREYVYNWKVENISYVKKYHSLYMKNYYSENKEKLKAYFKEYNRIRNKK